MEFIGTMAMLAVGIYLLYATGIMKLTQTASDKGIAMADRKLAELELNQQEKHTRSLGKINAKWDDETITRATAKSLKNRMAELEARLATTTTTTTTTEVA